MPSIPTAFNPALRRRCSFPRFPERVFFHPCVEVFGLGPLELRGFFVSFHDHDIARLEAVDKCAGLRVDENLRMLAYGTKQRGNHINRARVQSEFRFIHHNQGRQFLGRL